MGNEVGNNKFTWVIKNFPSLGSETIYSDEFVIDGCKWRLLAFPKGKNAPNHLSLSLAVADLRFGGKRRAQVSFKVVNQFWEVLSVVKALNSKGCWFDEEFTDWGFTKMINLGKLKSKNGGFMVNGEVKIVAKVDVRQVIGELDVPEETQPRKKIKMNVDGVGTSGLPKETSADWVDVNGFQVLPSQVEYVKRIFEKHPDMALECRAENQNLRTACMNVLLNLIDTLCKPLQDLSINDLGLADGALIYLKYSGFKVDWLEQNLVEVKGKKKEKENGETLIQELEEALKRNKQTCLEKEAKIEKEKEELKFFKQKCSDIETVLEKEKAKVLAAIATPVRFEDVV